MSYSIPAVFGATSYTWSGPSGSKVVSGQGTTSVRITFSNTAGQVTVKASNACGSGPLRSLNVAFICREEGDADQLAVHESIFAYPNPTTGAVHFSFISGDRSAYAVRVADLLGQQMLLVQGVAQEGTNALDLDLSTVAKGIYFIVLEREGVESRTVRIAVQ